MIFKASLNPKQFATFLTRMHARYPEFRHDTGGIPIYRAQIAKNSTHIQIKALRGYELPPDVEETAVRLLAEVQADTTLTQDAEIRWSEINRAQHRPLATVQTKRRRQEAMAISL